MPCALPYKEATHLASWGREGRAHGAALFMLGVKSPAGLWGGASPAQRARLRCPRSFTAWLGNNSSSNKQRRLLGELHTRMLSSGVIETDRRDQLCNPLRCSAPLHALACLLWAVRLPCLRASRSAVKSSLQYQK